MYIEFYGDGSFSVCDDKQEFYVNHGHDDDSKLPHIDDYIALIKPMKIKRIPIKDFTKAIKAAMEQEDEDNTE